MASRPNLRGRSNSPPRYAPHDNLPTQGSAGSSRGFSRDSSGNYRPLAYDGYTSDSGTYNYASTRGLTRYDYRLPYGGGPRARSPDYSVTRGMGAMSLTDRARGGPSSAGYGNASNTNTASGAYLPRPRARPSPSSLDTNRRPRPYRSQSAPRSYTPTAYAGSPRNTPSPEAVLGIPPRPMARPTPSYALSESTTYRSPARQVRTPSPPATAAAQRRFYARQIMGDGARRVGAGLSRALPPARPRLAGGGDSTTRTNPRSLSPSYADLYRGQAQADSASTRSIDTEELRAIRTAQIERLVRATRRDRLGEGAASHDVTVGRVAPIYLTPYITPWKRRRRFKNTRAQSPFYTVEEQERRNLDDAAGLLPDGESSVPFPYPRQNFYVVNRYAGGPYYYERPFSPRRPRRGFNWEYHPDDTEFSDATGHHSEDRGSSHGVDHGNGRGNFQAFTHHPHFPSIAEDQMYGVRGERWVNPNPRELDQTLVVEDAMDQNF